MPFSCFATLRKRSRFPAFRWMRICAMICALGLAFGGGMLLGRPSSFALARASAKQVASTLFLGLDAGVPQDVALDADFTEFWELWKILKSRYYKPPVEDKKLFYGALAGMTASLNDPYTVFFEPKSAQEFTQSLQGKFEGIGAEIGIKDDQLQIIAPLAEMPAEKAGLKPGDLIVKINGQETAGMSVEKSVSLIRGPKGTSVTLTIGRISVESQKSSKPKGKPTSKALRAPHKTLKTFEATIVRETIVVKSVRLKELRNGMWLLTITHFNQDTTELFRSKVSELLTKHPKGLILDLRNNPGGYLDRATAVAGEWLGTQLVVQERAQEKIIEQFTGTGSGRLQNLPTVVLVNQGSASAAEIVAGALQDYAKAKLVGVKTFGKGSVQDYIEFSDKSSVKITIAEWLTPHGRLIDKSGIEPDFHVDFTADDAYVERDPQLDAALAILAGKPPKLSPKAASPKRP